MQVSIYQHTTCRKSKEQNIKVKLLKDKETRVKTVMEERVLNLHLTYSNDNVVNYLAVELVRV